MFVWTVSDVIGVTIALTAVILGGLNAVCTARKQSKCPHARVVETGACNAVCVHCHKNLGFIGTWREKQRKEP